MVQDNYKVTVTLSGVVESFVSQTACKCTVTDNCDRMIILIFKFHSLGYTAGN